MVKNPPLRSDNDLRGSDRARQDATRTIVQETHHVLRESREFKQCVLVSHSRDSQQRHCALRTRCIRQLELRRSWQPRRNFVFNLRPSRRSAPPISLWDAGSTILLAYRFPHWPEAPPSSRVHPWKPEPWPPRERLHRPIASLLVSIRARPDSRPPSKGGYVSEFTAPYGTQPTLVDLIPRVPTRAVLLRHLCW